MYYPFLQPDDLFALGLLTWEICCREHPLARRTSSSQFERKSVGAELWELVRDHERQGKFYLSSILGAVLPSVVRPGMPPVVEALLLKALRLRVDASGKLDAGEGFKSFAEFADMLADISAKNICYL
jgi:hypothetical protein